MSTPTNKPAFPLLDNAGSGLSLSDPGMDLRDYFAAHASYEDIKAQAEVIRAQMVGANGIGILPDDWHCTARYMHADQMMKARAS
jgi:hypothetical protein